MPINDYRCVSCSTIHPDLIHAPLTCISCGERAFETYFGNWSSVQIDPRFDEREDAKGFIKRFGVGDDPLCAAQLGLTTDPKLASYNRLNEEQQKEFRGRLFKDGDSSKLRKDVLEAYNKAIGGKFEVQRD